MPNRDDDSEKRQSKRSLKFMDAARRMSGSSRTAAGRMGPDPDMAKKSVFSLVASLEATASTARLEQHKATTAPEDSALQALVEGHLSTAKLARLTDVEPEMDKGELTTAQREAVANVTFATIENTIINWLDMLIKQEPISKSMLHQAHHPLPSKLAEYLQQIHADLDASIISKDKFSNFLAEIATDQFVRNDDENITILLLAIESATLHRMYKGMGFAQALKEVLDKQEIQIFMFKMVTAQIQAKLGPWSKARTRFKKAATFDMETGEQGYKTAKAQNQRDLLPNEPLVTREATMGPLKGDRKTSVGPPKGRPRSNTRGR
jgi:hypothetical protein